MRCIVKFLAVALGAVALFQCTPDEGSLTKREFDVNKDISNISATVVRKGAQTSHLAMFVEVRNDGQKMPDEFYFNGVLLQNSGKDYDVSANDLIYSSTSDYVTNRVDFEVGYTFEFVNDGKGSLSSGRAQDEPCVIRIYGVGKDGPCGVCPKESITGGRTWFCICIKNCNVF